ncbi:hemin receptor [Chryseobacterium sp. CH25]|nr:hemin receptor [Chryseobacterium sp. CH25]RXM63482.1 hemin receptor [Chryseobacterium sp. CH1]
MSISAAFFAQAQDISVIKNSAEIYSNSPNIGSSKFNAMAGANGALGGDASSLLTNPAGLGVAISGDASGTLSINSNKNTSSLAGSSVKYTVNKTDIGNAGGVIAIPLMSKTGWKFINIGVNYSNQSIENYVESPGNQNITIPKKLTKAGVDYNANMSYLGHNYDRLGNQSKMNIGVGANYDNRFYIGAGLNFHYASIDQSEHAAFGLDLDNSVDTYKKQYTPYSERSNGFSASVGVIGKVSNQVRLGLSLETPTWWTIDRAFTEYYANKDDNNNIYYQNYGEDRSFRSPMKATVSAAFVPNKNFALNVDYTLGLTKPKYTVRGGAEADLNSFFNDLYKNVSEVKVGAEYRIQSFRLRGGYSYASSPFDAFSINAYNNAGSISNTNYSDMILGSRNTIGAGIGYDFGQFYIDAAYQNITSNYKNPFLYGDADAGTGYYGDFDVASPASVVSEVKNSRNNFFVTVGWKF